MFWRKRRSGGRKAAAAAAAAAGRRRKDDTWRMRKQGIRQVSRNFPPKIELVVKTLFDTALKANVLLPVCRIPPLLSDADVVYGREEEDE